MMSKMKVPNFRPYYDGTTNYLPTQIVILQIEQERRNVLESTEPFQSQIINDIDVGAIGRMMWELRQECDTEMLRADTKQELPVYWYACGANMLIDDNRVVMDFLLDYARQFNFTWMVEVELMGANPIAVEWLLQAMRDGHLCMISNLVSLNPLTLQQMLRKREFGHDLALLPDAERARLALEYLRNWQKIFDLAREVQDGQISPILATLRPHELDYNEIFSLYDTCVRNSIHPELVDLTEANLPEELREVYDVIRYQLSDLYELPESASLSAAAYSEGKIRTSA